MKILCTVTYYYPHISGLTAVAQTIAEALTARGHHITVLTSRYERNLALQERINGVDIVRVPALCRISKAPVMPNYWSYARRLMQDHEVILTHLPASPMEITTLAPHRRIRSLPMVVLYHCDLQLAARGWNAIINSGAAALNRWMLHSANGIAAHSDDYAHQSPVLRHYLSKTTFIPPPVMMPAPRAVETAALRTRLAPGGESIIGFVGRWAAEKGLDCLLDALPLIRRQIPGVKAASAGETNAIGENTYRNSLQSKLREKNESWQQLGRLDRQELADFFAACDVTVLPSINATESFGLVQVESMLSGTPVVATNLPGVRRPVQISGMGRIVPFNDPPALAQALIEVIQNRPQYVQPRAAIESYFSFSETINRYETLIKQIAG
jgi:glycosyltransferase involved in cell wall biosynthesis